MKKKFYVLAAIAALFTMSCSSNKMNTKEDLNGEWNVVAVNGQQVENQKMAPFFGLDMEGMRLSGSMSCNRLLGTIVTDSLHPEKISFDNVGSTRRMCPDMKLEQQISEAIEKVQAYEVSEGGVNLLGADGAVLFSLVKREAATTAGVEALAGKWIMKTVKDVKVSEMESAPFLEFNVAEKKVSGNCGCNIVNGQLVQKEGVANSLKFDQMATTRMACPDMDAESAILKLLNEVTSFEIDGEGDAAVLTLLNAGQEKVIALYRK